MASIYVFDCKYFKTFFFLFSSFLHFIQRYVYFLWSYPFPLSNNSKRRRRSDLYRFHCLSVRTSVRPCVSVIKSSLALYFQTFLCPQEVGRGEFLSLVLSNRTSGRYTCHARVKSFPPVSTTVTVQVRGPPSIVPGREVQHATIGQPLKVNYIPPKCNIYI